MVSEPTAQAIAPLHMPDLPLPVASVAFPVFYLYLLRIRSNSSNTKFPVRVRALRIFKVWTFLFKLKSRLPKRNMGDCECNHSSRPHLTPTVRVPSSQGPLHLTDAAATQPQPRPCIRGTFFFSSPLYPIPRNGEHPGA